MYNQTPKKMDTEVFQQFITDTDMRNLRSALRVIIRRATEDNLQNIEHRRSHLKKLLEGETAALESEFAKKVNSAFDDEIIKRRNTLFKIDEDDKKSHLEYQKQKRSQALMNSCIEIREAFSRKSRKELRSILDAQSLEVERKKAQEEQLKEYWYNVHKAYLENYDKQESCNQKLRKDFAEEVKFVVGVQQEDKRLERQREKEEKLLEGKRIDEMVRQMKLEEIDTQFGQKMLQRQKTREEFLNEIECRRLARQSEREREAEEFRKKCLELQQLEKEEEDARRKHKIDVRREFAQFGAFSKGVRDIKKKVEENDFKNIDELKRVDDCTKNSKVLLAKKKVEANNKYAQDLKKQICDLYERRIQEDIERREPGITYNPFENSDPLPEVIIARKQLYRKSLDEQKEVDKIAREKEMEYHLKREPKPLYQPEEIEELVQQCEFEGVDYLPPNPNWFAITCNNNVYTEKKSQGPLAFKPNSRDYCCRDQVIYKPKGGIICPPWYQRCHYW